MNAESALPKGANVVTKQTLGSAPTPRVDLATLADVRKEMARVYRRMRSGKLKPSDGTKFAFVLTSIAKLIESADMQARLEALERAIGQRKN